MELGVKFPNMWNTVYVEAKERKKKKEGRGNKWVWSMGVFINLIHIYYTLIVGQSFVAVNETKCLKMQVGNSI